MEFTVKLTDAQSHVIIEKDCTSHLKDYCDLNGKVMMISDTNIPMSLKNKIMDQIEQVTLVEITPGESSKSFETYQMLLNKLLELEFSRNDLVIALGGGVIGDLSGFVAATYKRGCRLISIPTTTLSQIDSSIGGKVAINLQNIKNCVGTFYHPSVVLVDITTLSTLPLRHFYNGLVEALKTGCIGDPILFDLFKQHAHELSLNSPYLTEIIERSLLFKKKVVEEDEKETGLRKILNFGHTIGHAIESTHLDEYYHGECVANGMILIEDNQKIKQELANICMKMNIPLIPYNSHDKWMNYIKNDKKAKGNEIDIVKVDQIGEAMITRIQIEDLRNMIEEEVHHE